MEQTVPRHTDHFERSRIAEIVLTEFLRAKYAAGDFKVVVSDFTACWVIAEKYLAAGVQHRKEKRRA